MHKLQGKPEYSVAMSESVDTTLAETLLQFIRKGIRQEDLRFALWNPSRGRKRMTALLVEAIDPVEGDLIHAGNVSFMPAYIDRASQIAAKRGLGLAILHSHFTPGWQSMSPEDKDAEQLQAGFVLATTGLPLVGMTLGTDGAWSSRFWVQDKQFEFEPQWCSEVRVVGEGLRITGHPRLRPKVRTRAEIRYATALWGEGAHFSMMGTHVGVIGLGSVGRIVAEGLARMGVQRVTFIDHDRVQSHNLDRLLGVSVGNINELKVESAKAGFEFATTTETPHVTCIPARIESPAAFEAALDCDVLFSCVDRPLPRHIMNCLSFSHLIPVIDGGIVARFHDTVLRGCEWSVRTAGPHRVCLECAGTYRASDVDLDRRGLLDDPSYLQGLPKDHAFRHNENVFPFSAAVAAQELVHFIVLVGKPMGVSYGEEHRWHLSIGVSEAAGKRCDAGCPFPEMLGKGDSAVPREAILSMEHGASSTRDGG